MSKRNRKRLLSVLLTTALIFTLALSSVMAQDEEHVRADKLSVGAEAVEDEEATEGLPDEEVGEISEDEATEETVSVDKINGAWSSEEDAADVVEEEPEGGVQALSAADDADDEYGIQTLADTTVTSGLQDAIDAASNGDTIMLGNDIEESITIDDGQEIILDLNGHTLSGGNSKTTILVNGTLTIMDSSGDNSGTITDGSATDGGGVELNSTDAVVTLQSGTISGNSASDHGAGVNFHTSGTFNMVGGVISGNTTAGNGGGVYVANNGIFNMSGGTICGNTSSSQGAGVYVDAGTFNMTGGNIYGNTAGDCGGGVSIKNSNAVFNFSGGMIGVEEEDEANGVIGNQSTGKGAGVYVASGTFNMGDENYGGNGSISYNTITGYNSGAGVFVCDGTTFNMYGGSITKNIDTQRKGGGVCVQAGATFNMYGGSITENVTNGSGSTDGYGGGVFLESSTATFVVYDGAVVLDNTAQDGEDNVYLYSGALITLGEELTSAASQIGVTTRTEPTETKPVQFTKAETGTSYYSTSVDYFTSDKGFSKRITESGNQNYLELYGTSAAGFEQTYLMEEDDSGGSDDDDSTETELYTSVTAANYKQILSGEDDWNNLDQDLKDRVDSDLTDANDGEALGYEDLLSQAKAFAADVNAFEENYLGGADSLYTEADANNYKNILAGISDWAAMSDEEKAAVNNDLTDANGGDTLTYEDLLAQAFQLAYLTDEDGNGPYTEVTDDNIDQILAGASDWALMSDDAKAQVNAALQAASGDDSLTYDDLLAQAFEQKYLMEDGDGELYTEATLDNYEQILAGEADWDAMSDEAKALVNAHLTEANGGETLTYPMLLEQAKALEAANAFIYNYVSDNDVDNPYLEATVDNYQRILAGEDTWNAMSQAEQDAVNAILTAAWQAAGHDGELTYPMLLQWAKDLAAQLESTGAVKTGDNTRLYLYLLLIAAAGAAASGAVVVSRRRV